MMPIIRMKWNPKAPTAKRDWILGAFIHSRPVVIHYADRSVIYAGANDGMLHAFDDETGEELWAFIPQNLLSKLKNLNGEAIQFFVDGPPKAYVERDSSNNISQPPLFSAREGAGIGTSLWTLKIQTPQNFCGKLALPPSRIRLPSRIRQSIKNYGKPGVPPQLGKIK